LLNKNIQLYLDQLIAGLDDRSNLNLGVWRSTSTVGANFNVYGPLQIGVNAFYDQLQPTGGNNGYDATTNSYHNLNQQSLGGLLNVGLRY
jgi:hypothetical protein